MKKLVLIFILCSFCSCVSVKTYNKQLETPIAEQKLKDDVDFAYKKLKKLHPNLYWYISKDSLNYKFDSLKATISKPLNPKEFYTKLAPVVGDIREGHLRLKTPEKRFTKKEIKKLKDQKGLFSRFNYVVDNNRIFVKDNVEKVPNMNLGTEILKINDQPVNTMLERWKPFITSDGFNKTYHKYSISRTWANFFTIENGILDSVKLETKYNREIKTFWLHRLKKTKAEKTEEKKLSKKDETKRTKDFNPLTKSFNRNLEFKAKDSSIAVLTVKTFSGMYSKKFYKESFAQLKKAKTQFLILDIRNNLGGSLSEIQNLYSYLAKDQFKFINDIEVTSRTSVLQADYFKIFPLLTKPIAILGYPPYILGSLLSTKKKNDQFYLRNNNIFTIKKPKKDAFNGKLYVLINGSSFSASSIISSKIKNDQRGILVGEETGGANDGTVAGRYATKKLPHSKLILPIGLMLIQPNIEFTNTQKGVTPNVEIKPTLQQILLKQDVEMEWILNDIAKKN